MELRNKKMERGGVSCPVTHGQTIDDVFSLSREIGKKVAAAKQQTDGNLRMGRRDIRIQGFCQ